MDAAALFDKAVHIAENLPKAGPIQTSYPDKLALYSLYKQATIGDVVTSRPGILDQLGRAKYDAWKKRAGLSKEAAMKAYADTLVKILKNFSDRTIAVELIKELEGASYKPTNILGNLAPSEISSSSSYDSSGESTEDEIPQPGPSSRPYRTPSGSIILPTTSTTSALPLPQARSTTSSFSRPIQISAAALKAHQASLETYASRPSSKRAQSISTPIPPLPLPPHNYRDNLRPSSSTPPLPAQSISARRKPSLSHHPHPSTSHTPRSAQPTTDLAAIQKSLESINLTLSLLSHRLTNLESQNTPLHLTLYRSLTRFLSSLTIGNNWIVEKMKEWSFVLLAMGLVWRVMGLKGLGVWWALVRRKIEMGARGAVLG